MDSTFYADFFSRTVKSFTPEELWEKHTRFVHNLATSEWAEKLAERFEVPEVAAAEEAFKRALETVSDPELRNTLDSAAGKISYAYQILGFCAGHFSQDSRAADIF